MRPVVARGARSGSRAIALAGENRRRAMIGRGTRSDDVPPHDPAANENIRHRRREAIETVVDEGVVSGHAAAKRVHRQGGPGAAADRVVSHHDPVSKASDTDPGAEIA